MSRLPFERRNLALLALGQVMLQTTAVITGSFALFCVATVLTGVYQAFGQYYRFAAAEAVADAHRSRAISWVIGAGVVAAMVGPMIVRATQAQGARPYAATLLVTGVLGLAAVALVSGLRLGAPAPAMQEGPARPLGQIVAQPAFLTAVACSTVGYAVMVLVMTATPLAMLACGFPVDRSATVIQWHVLGMFVPAFFTGSLIDRIGVLPVIVIGVVLLTGEMITALGGLGFAHFVTSLILLGVGWNFLFIGGTTLLTRSYRPSERAKAQATHDLINFGAVSVASLGAGGALNLWGWSAVNWAVAPLLAVVLLAVGLFAISGPRIEAGG